MRLGYDLRLATARPGGTRRYAVELLRAMRRQPPSGWSVAPIQGWPRVEAGDRLGGRAQLRRAVNLAGDVAWLTLGADARALRRRLAAWFAPANAAPLAMPRPVVFTVHDLNVLVTPESYDAAYARYAGVMLRLAIRRAARVVAVSEYVRRGVLGAFDIEPSRVVTIASGLDHLDGRGEQAQSGVPRPYALFVGRTERHKNVGLLLEAWRAGVPPELHLVVCGPPGRTHGALLQAGERPELRARVHFLGEVPDARLVALYRDADLFLFPSLAEGFGLPPLEAMRHGVPTAVAEAASLPEVTAGGALTFDPHDADALAHLVVRMRQDGDLRSTLRSAGPAVAARYRWGTAAARVWEEVDHAVRG